MCQLSLPGNLKCTCCIMGRHAGICGCKTPAKHTPITLAHSNPILIPWPSRYVNRVGISFGRSRPMKNRRLKAATTRRNLTRICDVKWSDIKSFRRSPAGNLILRSCWDHTVTLIPPDTTDNTSSTIMKVAVRCCPHLRYHKARVNNERKAGGKKGQLELSVGPWR